MRDNELTRLRHDIHQKILIFRSFEHYIQQPRFARLWQDSSPEERDSVVAHILEGNKVGFLKWLKLHSSLDFGEMGIRELRLLASVMNVSNYSRLLKPELISELNRMEGKADGST